jgi:hypothetical protein
VKSARQDTDIAEEHRVGSLGRMVGQQPASASGEPVCHRRTGQCAPMVPVVIDLQRAIGCRTLNCAGVCRVRHPGLIRLSDGIRKGAAEQ